MHYINILIRGQLIDKTDQSAPMADCRNHWLLARIHIDGFSRLRLRSVCCHYTVQERPLEAK